MYNKENIIVYNTNVAGVKGRTFPSKIVSITSNETTFQIVIKLIDGTTLTSPTFSDAAETLDKLGSIITNLNKARGAYFQIVQLSNQNFTVS